VILTSSGPTEMTKYQRGKKGLTSPCKACRRRVRPELLGWVVPLRGVPRRRSCEVVGDFGPRPGGAGESELGALANLREGKRAGARKRSGGAGLSPPHSWSACCPLSDFLVGRACPMCHKSPRGLLPGRLAEKCGHDSVIAWGRCGSRLREFLPLSSRHA